jgi:hypothetical protein
VCVCVCACVCMYVCMYMCACIVFGARGTMSCPRMMISVQIVHVYDYHVCECMHVYDIFIHNVLPRGSAYGMTRFPLMTICVLTVCALALCVCVCVCVYIYIYIYIHIICIYVCVCSLG